MAKNIDRPQDETERNPVLCDRNILSIPSEYVTLESWERAVRLANAQVTAKGVAK